MIRFNLIYQTNEIALLQKKKKKNIMKALTKNVFSSAIFLADTFMKFLYTFMKSLYPQHVYQGYIVIVPLSLCLSVHLLVCMMFL